MADRDALLRAILVDPFDDAPRLVYADYLDEHGDPEWAAFIRVQVEIEPLRVWYDDDLGDQWYDLDGPEAADRRRLLDLLRRERGLWRSGAGAGRFEALRPLSPAGPHLSLPTDPAATADPDPADPPVVVVRRGFPAAVRCATAAFLAHAGGLFRSHPVTDVRLTDRRPYPDTESSWGWRSDEWGVLTRRGDPDLLPAGIHARLPATGDDMVPVSYPTEEAGAAALSRACVAYGRVRAGLPHLGG